MSDLRSALVRDQWSILVEKDDRTSPEEYPDMCLITQAEVGDIIDAALSAQPQPEAVEAALTCDFAQSLPGGKLDDSTYGKIEGALDKIEAPAQDANGKWLSLHERIATICSPTEARMRAALEKIAGSHWERVGYCQSDVEDVPELTAEEAMREAREALSGAADVSNASAEARLREAVNHARARFSCLAEDFSAKGCDIDRAMCEVDEERMTRALSPAGADEGKESEGGVDGHAETASSRYGKPVAITCLKSETVGIKPGPSDPSPPDATAQREAIARIIGSFPTHPHDGDEQYVLHDAFPGDYDRRTAKIYELTDAVLLALQTRAGG